MYSNRERPSMHSDRPYGTFPRLPRVGCGLRLPPGSHLHQGYQKARCFDRPVWSCLSVFGFKWHLRNKDQVINTARSPSLPHCRLIRDATQRRTGSFAGCYETITSARRSARGSSSVSSSYSSHNYCVALHTHICQRERESQTYRESH